MAKAKRVQRKGVDVAVLIFCPGCEAVHSLTIKRSSPCWEFNGDLESPTFSPSLLVYETKGPDGNIYSPRCHSFIREGRIQFLTDCGHSLAGETVDLPEFRWES